MNPPVKIGRYEIPIGSVSTVQRRVGAWGQLLSFLINVLMLVGVKGRPLIPLLRAHMRTPVYDVYLVGGLKLRFNEAEKTQLDEELSTHQAVMQVMGMIAGLQANQRPGR